MGGGGPAVPDIDKRIRDARLERGLIEVTLAWDGPSDLDLHVKCPGNQEISYNNQAACGGRLVSKDLGVGGGDEDAHQIEHIVWKAQPVPTGSYAVHAVLYKRYSEKRPGIPYRVVLRLNGQVLQDRSGSLSTEGQDDSVMTFNSPVTR